MNQLGLIKIFAVFKLCKQFSNVKMIKPDGPTENHISDNIERSRKNIVRVGGKEGEKGMGIREDEKTG